MAEKISPPSPERLRLWQTFPMHVLLSLEQVQRRGLVRIRGSACPSRKFQPKSRPKRVIFTRPIRFEKSQQPCSAQ